MNNFLEVEKPYKVVRTGRWFWFIYMDKFGESHKIRCDKITVVHKDIFLLMCHSQCGYLVYFNAETYELFVFGGVWDTKMYRNFVLVKGLEYWGVLDTVSAVLYRDLGLPLTNDIMPVPLFVNQTLQSFSYPRLEANGRYSWESMQWQECEILSPEKGYDGGITNILRLKTKENAVLVGYYVEAVPRNEIDTYEVKMRMDIIG